MNNAGAEFALEPDIGRASIFNGMEKNKKGGRNCCMVSSSIILLKGQEFVGGIGKSSKLQMHWTAGYFPLPWPAKESSFKTHLPVNILAWLRVISHVSARPSEAWRRTCTDPETDLVTSDFAYTPTASSLIVVMIHPAAYFLDSGEFWHKGTLKSSFFTLSLGIIQQQAWLTKTQMQKKTCYHHERWSTVTIVLIYKILGILNREILNDK